MRFSPGQRIDRFEIVEPLGEGAYAETYKACDTASGTVVVLKCPNPVLFADPGLFQRFRRETEIASRLHHPGVVQSVELVGGSDKRTEPYLVLEYVDGVNMRERISELGHKVPVDQAIVWGRELAASLDYLHAHGIVHRDMKPENILVTPEGDLKIADFGTALLAGARRLTWRHLSESLGTPDYMSPEQIQGGRGDERSDVYAWGVMMYELLSGSVPFRGDNWMAVMAGHMQRTPESIRRKRHEVPPALEAVVLKAMRRYPENRYQTAADLLRDFDNLDSLDPAAFDLSSEAPLGGMAAVGSARRLWRFIALVALAFIAFVAVVILISVLVQ